MRALDTPTVIARAKAIHGTLYSYDKFVYVNKRTKATITCRKHGDFEQLPLDHAVKGYGCNTCGYETTVSKRMFTITDFIARAQHVHGSRYDYTDSVYLGSQAPITIRCLEHGYFTQEAHSHTRGIGCAECGFVLIGLKRRLTHTEFVSRSQEVHGDRYDYSLTVYTRCADPVVITCRQHGIFRQPADSHLNGHGCPACAREATACRCRLSTEQFVQACLAKRGSKYNYDKVQYVNSNTDVVITCAIHGDFSQNPGNHLYGTADCPKCSTGRFSKVAIEWLEYRSKQDGVYIQHAMNDGEKPVTLLSGRRMKFDGYAAETNTVYEFYGDYYHGNPFVYDSDLINAVSKRRMGDLWEETCSRNEAILSLGYHLVTIWESDWRKLCKVNFFDD